MRLILNDRALALMSAVMALSGGYSWHHGGAGGAVVGTFFALVFLLRDAEGGYRYL